mmetsp:Transcript_21886/g.41184  ORF Transcript_21886/g.41184 Transcript_21886/m.41184 type:complete len:238 (-) Transcript_21886:1623-2336(-)
MRRRFKTGSHVDVGRQITRVDLVVAADSPLDGPPNVQPEAHLNLKIALVVVHDLLALLELLQRPPSPVGRHEVYPHLQNSDHAAVDHLVRPKHPLFFASSDAQAAHVHAKVGLLAVGEFRRASIPQIAQAGKNALADLPHEQERRPDVLVGGTVVQHAIVVDNLGDGIDICAHFLLQARTRVCEFLHNAEAEDGRYFLSWDHDVQVSSRRHVGLNDLRSSNAEAHLKKRTNLLQGRF